MLTTDVPLPSWPPSEEAYDLQWYRQSPCMNQVGMYKGLMRIGSFVELIGDLIEMGIPYRKILPAKYVP